MKRLFGTDGIRGVAGEPPLDPATVRRFGLALARMLGDERGRPGRVALGRDTRESGPWLTSAVTSGLTAGGAEAADVGLISTPGLARAVRGDGFDAGVMISASHNPFTDNGLKVFDERGFKLSDALEKRVEDLLLVEKVVDPGDNGASPVPRSEFVAAYSDFLAGVLVPQDRFRGIRVALDCANGSATHLAPDLFRRFGAEVVSLGTDPDGRNINLDCGSLHLEQVARATIESNSDLGLAFDGDADRALAVDKRGRVVDGDHILYITARTLKHRGLLRGDAIVATILSNLWLEQRLAEEGIGLHRAPVGDKYVLERMLAEDLVLGGEQSGHVIFRDHATTGDGILTGLLLLDSLLESEQRLDEILDGITPCPQVQLNVRVREKPDLRRHSAIGPAVEQVEAALDGAGRVVLRYSGTEPLARVMVEGQDRAAVQEHAECLVRLIQKELGA